MATEAETVRLNQNETYIFAHDHVHEKATYVRCTVNSGKGTISLREFGEGTEHLDGPFDLASESGGRVAIELDLDMVPDSPYWGAIVMGNGEGVNEFLLELLTTNPTE